MSLEEFLQLNNQDNWPGNRCGLGSSHPKLAIGAYVVEGASSSKDDEWALIVTRAAGKRQDWQIGTKNAHNARLLANFVDQHKGQSLEVVGEALVGTSFESWE